MSASEMRAVVTSLSNLPAGEVTLRTADGAHRWTYALTRLGLHPDADALVAAALAYVRSGNLTADLAAQWTALTNGANVDLRTRLDQEVVQTVVDKLAAEVDTPAVVATLQNQGGAVAVVPGRAGKALDRQSSLQLLLAVLSVPGAVGTLELPLQGIAPAVDERALIATRDQALALTGQPITIRFANSPAGMSLTSDALHGALVVEAAAGGLYSTHLDAAKIRALVEPLAAQARQAPRDATLQLVKGKPVVSVDVPGWEMDLDTATTAVLAAAESSNRDVNLTLRPIPAAVPAAKMQPIQAQWNALVKDGFTLRNGEKTWTIKAATISKNMTLTVDSGVLPRIEVNPKVLTDKLKAIGNEIDLRPRDARFRLVDGAVKVVAESRDGQALDQAASLAAAQAALAANGTEAALTVTALPAQVSSAVPPTINTPDLLAKSQTSYKGSSPERAHNVEFGTSKMDGALVPPGGEFDTSATMGPLTLAAGFKMGYGIVSDGVNVTTVPSEAGGICQVSTTLFHSVFWAGLPITERNYHSYWIATYGREPSGLQGLDATIAPPEKNFRWRNPTSGWILIKAQAGGGLVNFELWGTNPGWKVEVDKPVITNIVQTSKKPIYENSNMLPWGTTRMVEHAQNGFTSDIARRVYAADGTLIDEWHAKSRYLPAHDRYLVGQKGRPAPKPQPTPTVAPPTLGEPLPGVPLAPPLADLTPIPPAPKP
jgi:vancomycin resistance protein YoaR